MESFETGEGRAMVKSSENKEKDNVPCQIEEGLFLGSRYAAFNINALKDLNVTHILTLAHSIEPTYPNDFTYKTIKVHDLPDTNLEQHFDECFEFIDEARTRGGGVLVHCRAGVSRSATVVTAYMMKKHHMILPQALNHVKSKRPRVLPNSGFISQLRNFEKSIADTHSGASKYVFRLVRKVKLLAKLYKNNKRKKQVSLVDVPISLDAASQETLNSNNQGSSSERSSRESDNNKGGCEARDNKQYMTSFARESSCLNSKEEMPSQNSLRLLRMMTFKLIEKVSLRLKKHLTVTTKARAVREARESLTTTKVALKQETTSNIALALLEKQAA